MSIRNILSIGLLILALVLAFMPWKAPDSSKDQAPSTSISSDPNATVQIPVAPAKGVEQVEHKVDWLNLILTHRKLAGIIIVFILAVIGVVWTKRFFDKI